MNWRSPAVVGLLIGAGVVVGQWLPPLRFQSELHAQGRGPVNPAPPDPVLPTQPTASATPIVVTEDGGQTASTNGFLAVTGSYGVGTSVLYLIDTVNRQLAVYEARGGSTDQRRVVLVGARKIDLDLKLQGYNDRSEYEYRRLRDVFEKRGANDPDVSTGLEPGRSGAR